MQYDAMVFDYLKHAMGFESDVQLMNWIGISRDSLSGIRTGRLPMGDSIRFVILDKWWTHVRPHSSEQVTSVGQVNVLHRMMDSRPSTFSPQLMLDVVNDRLKAQGKASAASDALHREQKTSPDGALLDAYKVLKGCATDAELAGLLGIKRQSISMVRSGRNGIGPIPLLRIYEDVMDARSLGLPAAVQSSHALLQLFTQGRVQQQG